MMFNKDTAVDARRLLSACAALAAALLAAGCAHAPVPVEPSNMAAFQPAKRTDVVSFADRAALAELDAAVDPVYVLGAGDHLSVQVLGRPEMSARHIVGPDGRISMPLVGTLRVAELTREEATASVQTALQRYFKMPAVALSVEQYSANRVTVLGRVQNPGVLNFDKVPTILEVLARAGGLPVLDKQATLTRCAIFRGRDRVIWIDLKHLLARSDPAYNVRLKPNDIVYIPDSGDTSVYVMGAVPRPGAYRLTPDMSLLDALAQAGGPNEDAASQEIAIYRPSKQALEKVPLKSLLTADRRVNFALEEGDIVYIPKSTMAEVGYVLRQLAPGLGFLSFGFAFRD
jgi:polysaccharide export outer membrane protein